MSLLEARELFVKKVNNHRAEYKAGEYGEKASNACKRGDEVHFTYIEQNIRTSTSSTATRPMVF